MKTNATNGGAALCAALIVPPASATNLPPPRGERRCARSLGSLGCAQRSPTLKRGTARYAFTLVELLVVIAIIGLLAGLIVYLLPGVTEKRVRSRAKAELNAYVMAINAYKTKLGFYPPDNPNGPGTNSLFYELTGTERVVSPSGPEYESIIRELTLVGQRISTNTIGSFFSSAGFLNSGDERQNFLPTLKSNSNYKAIAPGSPFVQLLVFPSRGPGGRDPNPWHYDSSNPTHNPDSFDLWVEVELGNKTIVIGNWTD